MSKCIAIFRYFCAKLLCKAESNLYKTDRKTIVCMYVQEMAYNITTTNDCSNNRSIDLLASAPQSYGASIILPTCLKSTINNMCCTLLFECPVASKRSSMSWHCLTDLCLQLPMGEKCTQKAFLCVYGVWWVLQEQQALLLLVPQAWHKFVTCHL